MPNPDPQMTPSNMLKWLDNYIFESEHHDNHEKNIKIAKAIREFIRKTLGIVGFCPIDGHECDCIMPCKIPQMTVAEFRAADREKYEEIKTDALLYPEIDEEDKHEDA